MDSAGERARNPKRSIAVSAEERCDSAAASHVFGPSLCVDVGYERILDDEDIWRAICPSFWASPIART